MEARELIVPMRRPAVFFDRDGVLNLAIALLLGTTVMTTEASAQPRWWYNGYNHCYTPVGRAPMHDGAAPAQVFTL
jgi:hypothetical protein